LRVSIEYFGDRGGLLGSLHVAQRLQPRSTAVVLCNPFGEEASRSHRTYRVLATQLERLGYTVIRFDYSGTGDSLGESDEVSIAHWVTDIGTAAERVRQASKAQRVCLVGVRFGATLAALAAQIVRPRQLVMWDPIVDGRAYLAELAAQHESYMRDELGRSEPRIRSDGTPTEALGMPISAALAAEIAAIDLATVRPPADVCTVLATRPVPDAFRANLPSTTQWIEMTETTAWNNEAALNAMVVPMDIVQALIARIEKSCS